MNDKQPGIIGRCWAALRRPSGKYSLLALLAGGFVAGILFWGGFNTAMEATNTISFCTSCHEMHDNVYQEYQGTIHDSNRTGVRAICSDCHVPRDWVHKVARKIRASNEVYHWLAGTVGTKEKFEAHRLELAQHVWQTMKETDSRECRNCHSFGAMKTAKQSPRARTKHLQAQAERMTCIDCHKGIAHLLPRDYVGDE
jgi:cytochrome c-type protein NapC